MSTFNAQEFEDIQEIQGLMDKVSSLQQENAQLRKEVEHWKDSVAQQKLECEKLHCLVLHAMSYAVVSLTSKTNKFKPFRLYMKYYEAYRKAKNELRKSLI